MRRGQQVMMLASRAAEGLRFEHEDAIRLSFSGTTSEPTIRSPEGRWPLDFDPAPYSNCPQVRFVLDATDPGSPMLRADAFGAAWWGDRDFYAMSFEAHQPAMG